MTIGGLSVPLTALPGITAAVTFTTMTYPSSSCRTIRCGCLGTEESQNDMADRVSRKEHYLYCRRQESGQNTKQNKSLSPAHTNREIYVQQPAQ